MSRAAWVALVLAAAAAILSLLIKTKDGSVASSSRGDPASSRLPSEESHGPELHAPAHGLREAGLPAPSVAPVVDPLPLADRDVAVELRVDLPPALAPMAGGLVWRRESEGASAWGVKGRAVATGASFGPAALPLTSRHGAGGARFLVEHAETGFVVASWRFSSLRQLVHAELHGGRVLTDPHSGREYVRITEMWLGELGTMVRVQVVDAQGDPVGGASVLSGGRPVGRTDALGRIEVASAVGAQLSVEARAEVIGGAAEISRGSLRVGLRADERTLTLRLGAVGKISGVVRRLDGRPLSGIEIVATQVDFDFSRRNTFYPADHGKPWVLGLSGSGGGFVVHGIPPADTIDLWWRRNDGSMERVPGHHRAGERVDVMVDRSRLVIVAVDAESNSLVEARLRVLSLDGKPVSARTPIWESAVIGWSQPSMLVAEGEVILEVVAVGYLPTRASIRAEQRDGDDVVRVPLTRKSESAVVNLTVRTNGGRSVECVPIRIQDGEGRDVDADSVTPGRVMRITGLAAGTYEFSVSSEIGHPKVPDWRFVGGGATSVVVGSEGNVDQILVLSTGGEIVIPSSPLSPADGATYATVTVEDSGGKRVSTRWWSEATSRESATIREGRIPLSVASTSYALPEGDYVVRLVRPDGKAGRAEVRVFPERTVAAEIVWK
jgi:hypothetical protein